MNLLFDLDGTLTDPRIGITNSIIHALKHMNIDIPGNLDWCIGPPLLASLQIILKDYPQHKAEHALELYRQYFSTKGLYENQLYDGILGVLQTLKQRNIKLYVATSKPTLFAIKILQHFNIDRYFEKIYGSELDGLRSDKGELIAHILEHEQLDSNETIMIGDRDYDLIGANKNYIASIGVSYGYGSHAELMACKPRHIVASPDDLLRVL